MTDSPHHDRHRETPDEADEADDAPDDPVQIWHDLLRGQRSLTLRLMGSIKRDYGLTMAQFEALLTLADAPDRQLTSSELASMLLYSSGSASHLIARLESLGHVERRTCPGDARVVQVALTPTGAALITAARRAHRAGVMREFGPLLGADRPEVAAFAARLARHGGLASRSTPAEADPGHR